MTGSEKYRIAQMRTNGVGVTQIAKELGLSINTVKAHCRRNSLAVIECESVVATAGTCKQCGKPVAQQPHRKEKRFCSDVCRLKWWNCHRAEVPKKSGQLVICTCCGREFTCYDKEHRKYCSHQCYIADRFGGVAADDARAV